MINNPCTYPVGKDKIGTFVFPAGDKLYHFCTYASGLSSSNDISIIFLAFNKENAKQIVHDMLTFKIKCLESYKPNCKVLERKQIQHDILKAQQYIKDIDYWLLEPAPANQVHVVDYSNTII